MSDDSAPIKEAIQDQLVRFDITSKKIELIKQASTKYATEHDRLLVKLQTRQKQIILLRKELNADQYIVQNLQNENPPNMKKLEKQHAKIEKDQSAFNEANRAFEMIKQKITELDNAMQMESKLEELQSNYKQLLANLINLHTRYPDVYKEAEQECGIFFLTSPAVNDKY